MNRTPPLAGAGGVPPRVSAGDGAAGDDELQLATAAAAAR